MTMREIPLTRGKVALVDDEDFERVSQRRWQYLARPDGKGYAVRTDRRDGRKVAVLLHRFVLDAPAGLEVDHRDGDGLNCQRANLRLCTRAENARNRGAWGRSGYLGVRFCADLGRWRAEINAGNRSRSLGYFDTAAEAARAYDRAASQAYGEFARLNCV